ncbi:MAG: N-acetylneuraminate synthase [Acidobacteriaceae bacterium]
MQILNLNGRKIGADSPCFIIAEAGVNHNGDLGLAKRLVDAALEAGADAVKFQTFRAEEVVSVAAPKAEYQEETTGTTESQLEMVRKLELSPRATREVAAHAASCGILFLSTGFDNDSVDLLDEIGVPAFKVGSGDLTNLPLLEHIASKCRPVILSTGMSFLNEVEEAVTTLTSAGCPSFALLQCVSSYPADPEAANLRVLHTLKEKFDAPVGFSDHSLGHDVAIAAVALGAKIIEKHLTLDANLPGPDHRVSLTPDAFAAMVKSIRTVEASLGDGIKRPTPSEQNVRDVARRSVVTRAAVPEGTPISREMLSFKRPGTGIPPRDWAKLIGRVTKRDIPADSILRYEDLA